MKIISIADAFEIFTSFDRVSEQPELLEATCLVSSFEQSASKVGCGTIVHHMDEFLNAADLFISPLHNNPMTMMDVARIVHRFRTPEVLKGTPRMVIPYKTLYYTIVRQMLLSKRVCDNTKLVAAMLKIEYWLAHNISKSKEEKLAYFRDKAVSLFSRVEDELPHLTNKVADLYTSCQVRRCLVRIHQIIEGVDKPKNLDRSEIFIPSMARVARKNHRDFLYFGNLFNGIAVSRWFNYPPKLNKMTFHTTHMKENALDLASMIAVDRTMKLSTSAHPILNDVWNAEAFQHNVFVCLK